VSPQRERQGRQAARQGRSTGRIERYGGAARVGLVLFGVLLVALFAGFAIAQGIGRPNVPSDAIIIVSDVPGDVTTVTDCSGKKVEQDPGTITKAELDCAIQQTAAQGGLPKVPKPGDPQYEDVRNAAIGDLLDAAWIQGEAADRGISVTQRQIDAQLEQIVSQNFACKKGQDPFQCKELQQFLATSHFSRDDVLARVRLQLLSNELQKQIAEGVPAVTAGEIGDYYDAAKDQFTVPPTRDARLVLNKDKAKVEAAKSKLEQDDSTASWNAVAKQYSTDPSSKDNGGLRPGLTEGLLEQPLSKEIFAASTGELVGPVKTPLGYYVFEVEKVRPERTQPLAAVQAQIRSQVSQVQQQQAFQAFVDDFGSKWQQRTICDADYLIERCSNFKGSGHPANAPAACYEASPKKGRPSACPAPVLQAVPAIPGSINLLTPQGQRVPQRPQPQGLKPAPTALPGASQTVPISPTPAP
jgi:parvulin-like peptidyl-prolyl isomerase